MTRFLDMGDNLIDRLICISEMRMTISFHNQKSDERHHSWGHQHISTCTYWCDQN